MSTEFNTLEEEGNITNITKEHPGRLILYFMYHNDVEIDKIVKKLACQNVLGDSSDYYSIDRSVREKHLCHVIDVMCGMADIDELFATALERTERLGGAKFWLDMQDRYNEENKK